MKRFLYLKDVVTLTYNSEKCTGCGTCLSLCPRNVLLRANGKIEIADRDACIECGACQRNCPSRALQVNAGVGCAKAVINQMLGREGGCCVVGEGSDTSQCC